ncbi:BamA/TamA family outer membrane protein [Sphingobium sp. H33]|uniref:BamA/TamA family outer membrane protein n=2 Tax=Sphingobium nicotianae TaxID=2782607 RepID=A0A9X1DCH2_9SPHN|nr:BamA/TamA family outer membrane protein [Sphingobium nicotianae]
MMLAVPGIARAQPSPTTVPSPSATPAPAQTAPDNSLDLEEMPDIGLDWPDLAAPSASLPTDPVPEPEAASQNQAPPPPYPPSDAEVAAEQATSDATRDALAALDPSVPLRYHTTLDGFSAVADATFYTRFDTLSVLKQGEGDRANIAQIRRRGQSDTDLVDELLRARGYYDSRTRMRLGVDAGTDPHVNVILGASAGPRYLLSNVQVFGLEGASPLGTDLRGLFTVKQGDPADTDAILAATDKLRTGLGEGGYPFADVREPVLTVDHQQREAILNLNVTTGGFRRFGEIKVNQQAPFDARHVAVISRFKPGQPYNQSDITDLDRALIATGLVSQVTITPQEGKTDQLVDLAISMTPAPPRTISGEIGYGTGEGARIEASWQHRNFFPPEGALTLRGVLGTQEQSLTATLRRNNLGRRDRVLNLELSGANVDQPAYQALTAGIAGSFERQTNLIFQKDWTWSFGAELRISDERDLYGASLTPRHRTYVIAALPTGVTYDGSDDLLDPRKGFRLGARISPEVSLQNGVFSYIRGQVDGSAYVPFSDRVTIAGRFRLGTIVGASADRIAPTRRYYSGGGGSVRGYGYQAIGPRDLNNDPVGGRSLGELSLEARFRFGSLNQFGLVPFIDAGTISADPWPSARELRIGAGLGLRYYSNFGPIRIDVGTPLNPQPGDSRIGVYVSLGQAF